MSGNMQAINVEQYLGLDKVALWKALSKKIIDRWGVLPDSVNRAYNFACKAHKGQKRLSGEDFIIHPLIVANLVADLGLGEVSIVSALLHDVVEDSKFDIEEVTDLFGVDVGFIVDGLTIVKDLTKKIDETRNIVSRATALILSSAEDIRILIIRILDKLHNMYTVEYLSEYAKQRFARRVLKVYGPLAGFIGMSQVKILLEDKAFSVLQPDEYNSIYKDLQRYYTDIDVKNLVNRFERLLKLNHIEFVNIKGRVKGVYSTYRKILRYKKTGKIKDNVRPLDYILDKVGVMLIVKDIESCYRSLELIRAQFEEIPGTFDDYILFPKPSGYRSLHLSIKIDNGQTKLPLEVQIKTLKMHEYNEFGPAAHIVYKMKQFLGESVNFNLGALQKLASWKDQTIKSDEFSYRNSILQDNVFVFTKDGDVKILPKGSTVIDFAFEIHTWLGVHLSGAKVNGKLVKIDTKLHTGDMIEILTTSKKTVTLNWLDKCFTRKTKQYIRKFVKEREVPG